MSAVFLDTNVLVYRYDRTAAAKRRRALELFDSAAREGTLRLSTQVLQEFFVAVTRPRRPLLTTAQALDVLQLLVEFPVVTVPPLGLVAAAERAVRYDLHLYDALVIEGALVAGCDTLYSEDLQHGQVVDGVRIENPF